MWRRRCVCAALLGVTVSLLSCGYIGNPQAPALDIPSPVVDLRAAEYGDRIVVEFTIPMLTTEGLPLKTVRSVDLYAGPPNSPFNGDAWGATAKRFDLPPDGPGAYAFDEIPVQEWMGKNIALGVRATGPKGRVSSWSNFVSLIVGPPLAKPTAVHAENTKDGVKLTWTGSGPRYRVFRWTGEAQPAPIAETDAPQYLDTSAQIGTEYRYIVMAIEGESHRSVVSDTASMTPKDEFAPAVPAGVTASGGSNSIELAWVRNTEADFRGYNVFRAEGTGMFEKIASLIEAPVFSDAKAAPGKMYRYQISAVDLAGNESARSETVTASIP
ncbi:MAG TPA: hypothetical protein VH639_18180 [Bryobacteraceae bacterium]|jgi:hypothetical protein